MAEPDQGSGADEGVRPTLTNAWLSLLFPARRRHVLVEPLHNALEPVANMLWVVEPVAFAGIENEFRLHSQRLERVPKLVRLRRRALRISIAHNHERRRLHVLDEIDRRTFRIHRR